MKHEGLPKKERLTKNVDFESVLKEGKKVWIKNLLLLIYKPNNLNYSRIGIVVSKKIKKATQRNKIKRWIREFYRRNKSLFPKSCDMVFIPHPSVVNVGNYEKFCIELKEFLSSSEGKIFYVESLHN